MVISLEAIFGDSYSITFGDGLVTVKPQLVTMKSIFFVYGDFTCTITPI